MNEQKPGQGILFPNDRKSNDRAPDYTGRGMCPHCSVEMELAGWKKMGKAGRPFLSMKLSPPRGDQRDSDNSPPF